MGVLTMVCAQEAQSVRKVGIDKICGGMTLVHAQTILDILTSNDLTPKQFAGVVEAYHNLEKKDQKPVLDFAKSVNKAKVK